MSIRRRPKLGARAPLSILLGNVPDAVDYIFESNEEAHKQLSALGVEREESNEHHLQAALSHTNVIHNRENRPASPSFVRAAAKPATQPLPAYFIPTPNASGKAEDYESLLPTGRPIWTDPSELIKSSEKVEECCYGRGGLNYEMDDTDILWLEQLNGKDDGPSNEVTNARSNRKANQKEKDGGFVKLPADIFEYLMGLFELWTEKNVPMLHTDLSLLPPLSSIESVLKVTPPASYFPSFEQPKDLPSPSTLIKYANKIYSHWKARKEQRKGKSIIPQLNFDEANESDPYLCFRRRDLKVQRKTRIKDTTPVSRLDQVQAELNSATLLVNMVLMRERQKQRTLKAEKELWDARWSLLDIKRKNPGLPLSQDEEILLFPHRISSASGQPSVKRQRVADRDREQREREDAARVAHLQGVSMLRGMRSRAVSPVGERVPPEQLAGMFAEKVEREMSRRIEIDRFAEETTALAYQPFPQPVPFKHFRCLPASDLSLRPQHLPETVSDEEHDNSLPDSIPSRPNHHMCFRLRRGRGGLTRLDRKMPSVRHLARSHLRSAIIEEPAKRWFPTNPLAKRNLADTNSSVLDHARSGAGDALDFQDSEEDRSRQLSERWRYDYDGGLVGVGMGVKDEDQVVIDDYETRYIQSRASLIKMEDLDCMTANLTVIDKVRSILAQPEEKPAPITFTRAVPPQLPQTIQAIQNPSAIQIPYQQQQADIQAQLYQQQREAQQLLQQHAQVQAAQAAQAQALGHAATPHMGNTATQYASQQIATARRIQAAAQNNPQLAAVLAASGGQPMQVPQVRRIASGNVGQMGPPQGTGSPAGAAQALPPGQFPVGRQIPNSPALLNAMAARAANQTSQGQQIGATQPDQAQRPTANGAVHVTGGRPPQSASPVLNGTQIQPSPRQPPFLSAGASASLANGSLPQNFPPEYQQKLIQMKQQQMLRQQQQQNNQGLGAQTGGPATSANGQMNLQLPTHRMNQMMAAQRGAPNGVQGQMRAGGSPITAHNSPQMTSAQTTMSVGGPGQ